MNSSNSNLDDIIMERLKSRQEKLSAIKEWQDKRHRKHNLLTGLIVTGMAASILFGIFTFKPFALQDNDMKGLEPAYDFHDESFSLEPMDVKENYSDSLRMDSLEMLETK